MKDDFEQKVYRHYISTHFGDFNKDIHVSYKSRYYLWRSYLTGFLPKNQAARILEIGSGMGHNLYELGQMGYKHVVGFDISKECIDFCRKQQLQMVSCRNLNVLINQRKHKKAYDVILIYDLLEHLEPERAHEFLRQIKELLARDGSILISVPNGEFPFNLPMRYVDISHKFLYTSTSLHQLLALSDFHMESVLSTPSFSIYDDNRMKMLFKKYICYPISKISAGIMKLYLLSQGITLRFPGAQLFCLAKLD